MTDEQKALVARLRSNRPLPTLPHEAADLIDAQAAEIARLREAKWIVRHADTANNTVLMGMARDGAIAERDALTDEIARLREEVNTARIEALEAAAAALRERGAGLPRFGEYQVTRADTHNEIADWLQQRAALAQETQP